VYIGSRFWSEKGDLRMKPTDVGKGTVGQLSECLLRRLDSYALAASAAGVGLLALAQPAEARIVYTPVHRRITVGKDVLLDLNHDGRNDFKFHVQRATFRSGTYLLLDVDPAGGENGIWGENKYAYALPGGRRIGGQKNSYFYKSENFMAGLSATAAGARKYSGPWENGGKGVKDRYLGLKFVANGQTHLGWARLNVRIFYSQKVVIDAVLTGYAYETIPNKPIITGRQSGPENALDVYNSSPAVPGGGYRSAVLGMLASGSPALSIWRRKQSAPGEASD
jgi:hypothetical protein